MLCAMNSTCAPPGPDRSRRRGLVESELERILQSEFFRDSARSQAFLQFVVRAALDGRTDEIKERIIGVELFGRSPNYDTSVDSIVRVCAREVRRRLGQYNEQCRPAFRIELMAGCYTPEFHESEPPASDSAARTRASASQEDIAGGPATQASRTDAMSLRQGPSRRMLSVAGVLIVLALIATAWWVARPVPVLRQFWNPVLSGAGPVLICIGHPSVYHMSLRAHELFKSRHPDLPPGPYEIRLADNEITGADVVPVSNQYVGTGDAFAAAELRSTLTLMGKPSTIRLGSQVSFPELRNAPVILLGAYSNKWTMRWTDDLRYVFDPNGSTKAVVDRQDPNTRWAMPRISGIDKLDVDYAIISRVFDSTSGNTVISAAGLTQYGTQAAGELISRSELLQAAVRTLPDNWPDQNVQFVIKTAVVGSAPGLPQVIASHMWPISRRSTR